jgi:hypothetical protein
MKLRIEVQMAKSKNGNIVKYPCQNGRYKSQLNVFTGQTMIQSCSLHKETIACDYDVRDRIGTGRRKVLER